MSAKKQQPKQPTKPEHTMVWIRDVTLENRLKLDFPHVKWTYHEAFPIADIDVKAGLENTPRFGVGVDPHRIELLRNNLRVSPPIKAIMLWRSRGPNSAPDPLDGRCRLTVAIEIGLKFVAAYELHPDTTPADAKLLAATANNYEGKQATQDEVIALAIELLITAGSYKNVAKVARAYSLNEHTLARHYGAYMQRQRMSSDGDLNVAGAEKLSITTLIALRAIGEQDKRSDPVQRKACEIAVAIRANEPQVKLIVETINAAPNDQGAQLEALAELESRLVMSPSTFLVSRARKEEDKVLDACKAWVTSMRAFFPADGVHVDARNIVTSADKRAVLAEHCRRIQQMASTIQSDLEPEPGPKRPTKKRNTL